jgi:hypothetical protein
MLRAANAIRRYEVSTYGARGPVLVSLPALATPTNFKIDRGSHATALLALLGGFGLVRTRRIVSPQRTQRLIFHLSSSHNSSPPSFSGLDNANWWPIFDSMIVPWLASTAARIIPAREIAVGAARYCGIFVVELAAVAVHQRQLKHLKHCHRGRNGMSGGPLFNSIQFCFTTGVHSFIHPRVRKKKRIMTASNDRLITLSLTTPRYPAFYSLFSKRNRPRGQKIPERSCETSQRTTMSSRLANKTNTRTSKKWTTEPLLLEWINGHY